MIKKTISMFGVLFLITFLVAGCGNNSGSGQEQSGSQEEDKVSFEGTFEELLAKGDSLKCDFFMEDEYGSTSGIAYTDGSQVYQEAFMEQDGIESGYYMLVTDEMVYMWDSSEAEEGVRISLSEWKEKDSETEAEVNSEESQEINESFDYDCSSWKVDTSKFVIPKDTNFVDLNSIAPSLEEFETGVMGPEDMPDDLMNSDYLN